VSSAIDHPKPITGLVDEPLLRVESLDVADGSFAEWPNLEENAIEVGVCRPSQLAFPIFAIPAEFDVAVGTIVVSPDISRGCTPHRMANIVDIEWVTVTPSVQVSHRVQVAAVFPKKGSR
jgi:hypothetical protein